MSGETEKEPSGWTPDLLNRHLSAEIDTVRRMARTWVAFLAFVIGLLWLLGERAVKVKQVENDKALALEKAENDRHFETLNHENERTAAWRSETPSLDRFEGFEKTVDARFKTLEAGAAAEAVRGATAKTITDEARGAARESRGDLGNVATARRANRQLAIAAIAVAVALSGLVAGWLTSRSGSPPAQTVTTVQTLTAPAP